MKIRVYVVYYNQERDLTFLRKSKAREYVEKLQFYDEDFNNIYYRKEYIYV